MPKPCLLMFASLVSLDGFHLMQSIQLATYLTLEWSGGSMFHPLLHIYTKLLFVALKQLQTMPWIDNALLFLIDCEQTQHPFSTLVSHWQMFMQNGKYSALWYFQLLCQNEFVKFFVVFLDNCRIWVTWEFSIICICTAVFKVSIPLLNHYFQWCRIRITLIKPLLCFEQYFFPSESNALSTHEIQIFSLFWKFATVASLKCYWDIQNLI